MRVPAAISDAVSVGGFKAAWAGVRWLPERAAYALFDRIADVSVATGGTARLRYNYARVRPDLDDSQLDDLVREGMRSYLRYYGEAFRLPVLTPETLGQRVRLEGDAPVRDVIDAGGSAVCFLGHLGNWDLAGAWSSVHWTTVTTVAERLKPEQIFEEFLDFREGLGMTILPLTGGPDPFPLLREAARRPGVIPLLADRDLTRSGVEVDFCGHRARMAAGPAALALTEDRPLFPVSIRYERRGRGWGIVVRFHDEVARPPSGARPEQVETMTQACADALGEAVREHTEDWHMLQRVFVADLDPRRDRERGR